MLRWSDGPMGSDPSSRLTRTQELSEQLEAANARAGAREADSARLGAQLAAVLEAGPPAEARRVRLEAYAPPWDPSSGSKPMPPPWDPYGTHLLILIGTLRPGRSLCPMDATADPT